MTLSFHPHKREDPPESPRRSLSPERIQAWGEALWKPLIGALGGVFVAVVGGLVTLGSGCVKVQASDPDLRKDLAEYRREMREEILLRDREHREMKRAIGANEIGAKAALDKAKANEDWIGSYHPKSARGSR